MTASSNGGNNGQTVTRPQTPPGQPYTPNPQRPEAYTGTRRGDTPPRATGRRR